MEIACWIKHVLYKHGNPSSHPQNPSASTVKNQENLWDTETGEPSEAHRANSLSSTAVNNNKTLSCSRWRQTAKINLLPPTHMLCHMLCHMLWHVHAGTWNMSCPYTPILSLKYIFSDNYIEEKEISFGDFSLWVPYHAHSNPCLCRVWRCA